MTDRTFILIQAMAFITALSAGGWLLYGEHTRAERYKLLFEDAASIVGAQTETLDSAQKALALSNDVIGTCIETIVRSKEAGYPAHPDKFEDQP